MPSDELYALGADHVVAALKYIRHHVEAERFKSRISKIFQLEDIANAHRHMEANDHIGKIVVIP